MTTQLDAVRVLTGIIRRAEEAGLPRLSWSMPAYDGAALTGLPPALDHDDVKTAALAAWARHLGVKADTERCEDYTEIAAAAEVDGVRVRIFTHVDKTGAYGQTGGAR